MVVHAVEKKQCEHPLDERGFREFRGDLLVYECNLCGERFYVER
jgi:hypothetical protein